MFRPQLQAEEVVGAFIERIKAVNPLVNAVVDQRFADALREARELDARLDATPDDEALRGLPLLGVPLTVKESIAVKGELRVVVPAMPASADCRGVQPFMTLEPC